MDFDDADDEQMQSLRATFLATGKGRRPSLPALTMNNKLLYQLHLLKLEGDRTDTEVENWFGKLFPDSAYPPKRFSRAIERVAKKTATLSQEELSEFFATRVDFDFISARLDAQGVTRLFDKASFKKCQVTNEIALDLLHFVRKESCSPAFFFDIICSLSSEAINTSLKDIWKLANSIDKEQKKLLKNKSRQPPQKLIDFLNTEFLNPADVMSSCLPAVTGASETTDSLAKPLAVPEFSANSKLCQTDIHVSDKEIKTLKQTVRDSQAEISMLHTKLQAVTELYQSAVKDVTSLKAKNIKTATENSSLTEKVVQLKKVAEDHKQLTKSQLYKNNHKMKKRNELLKCFNSKLQSKIKQLEERQGVIKKEKLSLQKKVSHLIMKCSKLKKEQLAVEQDTIQNVGIFTEDDKVSTRDSHCNRFTNDVRMTVLGLQEIGVAASKCSQIIKIVSKHLFNQEITDLPFSSTATNIADEAHFLSKVHATEKVLNSSGVTLNTDGTSRQKQQYIGQQVTLDDGTLISLGFSEVATEDSDTLLTTTVSLLEELSDLYCQVTDQIKTQVFKELLEKITSLMSDRAAVMQCYNRKFDTYRATTLQTDTHTHFLYCNAHFLLGLSSSCEDVLKQLEKDACSSDKGINGLGRDSLSQFKNWGSSSESATVRLLRTTADVLGPRGDEKSGCRTEWLAFCKKDGFASEITSYRSNRFNSLFDNASAIFHHRHHIQLFLSKFSTSSNLKLQSVLADVSDQRLVSMVAAVALLNMYITKPYWKLVNSTVQYVDFSKYVKQMASKLSNWQTNPSFLFNTECGGIFSGEFLDEIDTSVHIVATENTQLVTDCLVQILSKFSVVLKRQLHDFLEGGVFGEDITEETRSALKSCPLTNLSGEHAFGDLDFSMQTKRHASLHHRSAANMMKRNKTVAWLEKKSKEEREHVLDISRKNAKRLRQKHRQQEELVKLQVQERIAENERKKKEREFLVAAEKQRVMDSVLRHGGPVKSARDVEIVASSGVEALKDQLKYLKIVLGKKIKVSGNKEQLKEMLRQYVQDGTRDLPSLSSPPCKRRRIEEDSSCSSSSTDTTSSGASDDESDSEPFTFQRQGQWLAVYYDSAFYIGQVLEVHSPSRAAIKFLAATKGRKDYFRWPLADDIAAVESTFVFWWDFDVSPVSSDGRIWSVPAIAAIHKAYNRIKSTQM